MAADIGPWLEELGLGKYGDVFVENEVGVRDLPGITNDDLKELGLPLGPRRRILIAIEALNRSSSDGDVSSDMVLDEDNASYFHSTTTPHAERRQLTIMFCDLVGSTALSRRLDPEDLRDVMRRYQDAVAGAVTRYGGHVAKYLGDGVLAYFGWPQAYEDQAERAVRAGLDAVLAVAGVRIDDNVTLAARAGIATGLVVVGDLIGESGRDAEAVTGETPNLAARLQGMAKPGQVVVGVTTHRLLGQTFALTDLGSHALKGFDDAVQAWAIAGEAVAEGRFDAAHGLQLTDIVGRETELQLLLDRWSLAKGGEGQAVLISGEAGIGKSRLMQGLRDQVMEANHTRIHLQCSPHHTNSVLYPTIQQLERAAGFASGDDGGAKLDKLEGLLREAGDDLVRDASLFANLLSLPYEARYGALTEPPQKIKEYLLEALVAQLQRLAERRPVLFLFEDTHWIDPTSQELLERVIGRLQESRVLLIVTHRPEWQLGFSGHNHVTALQLNRLGKVQGAQIVRAVAGEFVPDNVVERIVARADGVPLFVEELTKTLVEGGLSLEEAEIPTSLQASLMERLDRLGEAKEIAQVGAVIGRVFPHDLLAALVEKPEDELGDAMDRLVQSGLMFRKGEVPDTVYSFKHALVRDTAYESLLLASRLRLHRRVGETLEQSFPTVVDTEPEVIAHHWLEAGAPAHAITFFLQAGRIASQQSANNEALAHLNKALELHHKIPAGESGSDGRPERELEILLAMGPAQMIVKGYGHAEVGQLWDRAHQLAEELGADAHKFHIAWNLWLNNQMSGKLEQASIWSEIVIRLADASDDEEYKLQARHAAWTTALVRGQLAATVTHAEMGTAIYEPDRHHHCTYSYAGHDPGVCAHQNMATALSLQGFHDQALSKVKQAIELANQVGHGPSITIARASSCITLYQWRKPEELLESAQQAIAAADQYGPANFRAYGLVFRGWAMAVLGQGQKSLEDIEAAKRIGAAARLPGYLLVQGEVHLLFGELDRALSAVDEALTLIKMGVEKTYWADVTRLKAEILLAQSTEHGAVAEGLFQEALEIAAEQGARLFELRSVVGLARHRRNQGRTAEAHDLIRLIYEQFTDGFDTADLQAARILLNELS